MQLCLRFHSFDHELSFNRRWPRHRVARLEINTKIQSFKAKTKTNHAIHPTLVTTYPVVQNEYAADLQAVITAEDLFAE